MEIFGAVHEDQFQLEQRTAQEETDKPSGLRDVRHEAVGPELLSDDHLGVEEQSREEIIIFILLISSLSPQIPVSLINGLPLSYMFVSEIDRPELPRIEYNSSHLAVKTKQK